MAKNLVIVESPAKTRTLKKFLGRDYAVEASLGHIRDLVKGKKDIGIGPDFEPRYHVLPAKKEVVAKLRQAAKKADTIYLAPDPDREGEAIAWHIAEVLDRDPESIRRVTFNEITRRAVLQALSNPGEIDLKKVDAQQARRVLDRMMGFRLSPLLWEKVKQGLSAGRVQSVALKMVCDRQNEIEAFQPEEYWILGADLEAGQPPPFNARLHKIDGRKAEVGDGEEAAKIVKALEKGTFKVARIERKESRQRPSPPFITSRLQQEAARRFGFSVKRTMALAQGLYEGREIGDRGAVGLITYMRTDSTRVADEAVAAVRDLIAATYGADAVPDKPNTYPSKKGAQDAHEAIRPTTFDLPPDTVRDFLSADEQKLYKLIWDRFVASQMKPAVFDVTQVDVDNGPYVLRATGRVMKSPGFLAVYREIADEEANGTGGIGGNGDEEGSAASLPPLREGQTLTPVRLQSDQKFTQPPAQYSEATLVKALEENGIGRPSTYATILSTLSDREYAERQEGRFRPTTLGRLVNKLLQKGFNDILNEGYTAALEEQLDEIEDGKVEWKRAVAEFDEKFTRDLETAGETFPNVKREGLPMDESCPQCGSPLRIRFGRFGGFVACSNYPDCTYTRNLEEPAAAAPATNGDGAEASTQEQVPPCEECGRPMALKRSRFGTFYGCTGYPECKNLRKTGPKPEPPKPTGVPCFECGKGEMMEKRSRRGKTFWSCSRYPDCKASLWKKPVNKECPECGAKFLLEKVTKRAGTQYVCNTEGCKHVEDVEPVAAEA